jgi:hypothetical protein
MRNILRYLFLVHFIRLLNSQVLDVLQVLGSFSANGTTFTNNFVLGVHRQFIPRLPSLHQIVLDSSSSSTCAYLVTLRSNVYFHVNVYD